ncbi:MAG: serine/threonine protein kinase [Polyangiaceae bacterium]|nr:serine/threonine protein kinase [Polyangiaceae bacterium]
MPNFNDLRDRLRHAVFTGTTGQRYQVRELLGEGGQGWVFKASQEDAGAPHVVIKVLRPDLVASDAYTRFEREAAVLRSFSSGPTAHPHIVRFHEHGRARVRGPEGAVEVAYLVLEYVDGAPLSRVLAAQGGFGLPVARVRRILRQVVRALADLHAQNIIHRDLKPSNILIAQRETTEIAKVTDFGLVKMIDAQVNQTVTVAGASAGYAPPEQYEVGNRRVSPKTDVFSFGAILFEMLSGCEAFPVTPNDTVLRIVARMLGGDRPMLSKVSATVSRELRERPEISAALDREIARATDGDPENRHASIIELWTQVEALLRAINPGSISFPKPAESAPSSAAASDRSVAATVAAIAPTAPKSAAPPPITPRGSGSHNAATSRVAGKPMTGERLRGAAFSADGKSLVAVGAYGLYRYASGVWSALRAPRGVDAPSLRGLMRTPSGSLLLFGDGCCVHLEPGGAVSLVDIADNDAVWLGGFSDRQSTVLVGERRSRTLGLAAVIKPGSPATVCEIQGTTRLHAAARLDGGTAIVCGAAGALFMLDGIVATAIDWGKTGHLYAAAAAHDGGAVVVGSGGHALSIVAPHPTLRGVAPPATLEAVQTTRDLTSVIVDSSGTAWAAGSQGRLLVRHAGTWSRVPLEGTAETLIAIAATEPQRPTREIIALAEDGTVVEVALQ